MMGQFEQLDQMLTEQEGMLRMSTPDKEVI